VNYVVKQMAGTRPGQPVLLVIGSSFTFHGIDAAQLEAELMARGQSYHVLKFASGGLSNLERLRFLKEVRRRSPEFRPAVLMMEVSIYYDKQPLRPLENNLFSPRMVDMMDWETAGRALRWVWATSSLHAAERLRKTVRIAQHLGAHYVSIGTAFRFTRYRRIPIIPTPDLTFSAPEPGFSDEELRRALDRAELILMEGEAVEVEEWANRQYDAIIALLGREAQIGYYALPNLLDRELAYAWSFCRQEDRSSACIIPDRNLLNALRERSMWIDISHLFGQGTRTTTSWFAAQIAPGRP
jgi:hypothetical protein